MGKKAEPWALGHTCVLGSGNRLCPPLTHRLQPATKCHHCSAVRVVLALKPPPPQGKREESRLAAHPGAPDDLVNKCTV